MKEKMKLFSTEAVSKYHPDKYADQISDAILTECLRQDTLSHCGIETLVKDDNQNRHKCNRVHSYHNLWCGSGSVFSFIYYYQTVCVHTN